MSVADSGLGLKYEDGTKGKAEIEASLSGVPQAQSQERSTYSHHLGNARDWIDEVLLAMAVGTEYIALRKFLVKFVHGTAIRNQLRYGIPLLNSGAVMTVERCWEKFPLTAITARDALVAGDELTLTSTGVILGLGSTGMGFPMTVRTEHHTLREFFSKSLAAPPTRYQITDVPRLSVGFAVMEVQARGVRFATPMTPRIGFSLVQPVPNTSSPGTRSLSVPLSVPVVPTLVDTHRVPLVFLKREVFGHCSDSVATRGVSL